MSRPTRQYISNNTIIYGQRSLEDRCYTVYAILTLNLLFSTDMAPLASLLVLIVLGVSHTNTATRNYSSEMQVCFELSALVV